MKYLFTVLFGLGLFFAQAQENYTLYYGGKDTNDESRFRQIYTGSGWSYLQDPELKKGEFIDYKGRKVIKSIESGDKSYKVSTDFNDLVAPYLDEEAEKDLLGYPTRYAKFTSFSNTIEVWYTTEAPTRGALNPAFLPADNALVLRMKVNGGRMAELKRIEKTATLPVPEFLMAAQEVSEDHFRALIIDSRYTRIPVFRNEHINFSKGYELPKADALEEDSTYHLAKGNVILKKMRIAPELLQSGSVFARLSVSSNGDAYDRTGSVFLIRNTPGKKNMLQALIEGADSLQPYPSENGIRYKGMLSDKEFEIPIEVMRFFTSFGAGNFNDKRPIKGYDWEPEAIYEQEITSVFPNDTEELYIGVFIGNYAGNGHTVSLDLDFHPGWSEEDVSRKVVQPVFSTLNLLETRGQSYVNLFRKETLKTSFTIPEDLENQELLYTTTGHGGWGSGDEFTPRMNRILIDGKEVFNIVPWRTDCATYRNTNPASGNFGNGLSSSDLSRSNWCPGTLTPPFRIPLDGLEPGEHTIEVIIDQGPNQGSSFNSWSVSGILTGSKKENKNKETK